MKPAPSTKQVRGEPLIAKVLATALAEVARVGHNVISIEEVAARAGVNKTTIYRRWATPEALVLEAFKHRAKMNSHVPDTGTLRGDLIEYLRKFRDLFVSPESMGVIRLHMSGRFKGTLGRLLRARGERERTNSLVIFERALSRGELPRGTDVAVIRELLLGGLHSVVTTLDHGCTDATIERLVDIVLLGAARGGGGSKS